jgi:peroxiredoxin
MTDPAKLAGKMAPDFTLETDSGDSLTMSKLRGQPVVLVFFFPVHTE